MPRSPLILLAFVALPLFAAAPADAQPPRESNPSFAAALDEPLTLTAPAHDPNDPVARGFLGPLAGIGLIGASTLLGTVIGAAIAGPCSPTELCWNGLAVAFSAAIGAGAGLALFYPLGVALGGDAFGGRGDIGWTYLGGLIGTAVGAGLVGLSLLVADATGEWSLTIPAILLGIGAALAGPVIAYEMSDHSARTAQPSAPAITFLPTLNVDRYGAAAGIAGMF